MNLDSINTKSKISLYKRNPQQEKALQIINDIKNKKIQLKPTTDAHIQICNNLRELIDRYNRFHNLSFIAKYVIRAYDDAEFYGLIEKTESGKITELESDISEKDKEILRLKKQLAKYEGDDKPDDRLYSDLEEKE
ncbi:hypothetical protein AAA799P11_00599 [Marine Group I thaumarchaeote SCGC AAA799-P11]|uniref:Uncharacterized protein n=1 Tax=Marine Group I thaumarchaeote SCGC AAA799-P11 TaxID=1502295 RepID=A0A087S1K6_9ARCH|nr:hypothetical protein AAA799P11_00599 [Marine Group I thaumarchaeote SCGC AAA799-P11]